MPGVSGAKVILGAEYINTRLPAGPAAGLGLEEVFVFLSVTRQRGTRRLCSAGHAAGDGKYWHTWSWFSFSRVSCYLLKLCALSFLFSCLPTSFLFFVVFWFFWLLFFFFLTLLHCFPALVIPSQIVYYSPITSGMACPNDLGASDRESPGETALPFWPFCSCHFSSRSRIAARCCLLHCVSA